MSGLRSPASALCDLDDAALLKRFGSLGRLSKVAARRALAILPEIVRRGLYRKAGFASPYEFAAKKVGVSRDVVDKVLRLYNRIGHMPDLWRLLASGAEGWSKLEIVSTVATPDTANWWAERIPRWTRVEIADYVRRLRAKDAGRLGANNGDDAERIGTLPLGEIAASTSSVNECALLAVSTVEEAKRLPAEKAELLSQTDQNTGKSPAVQAESAEAGPAALLEDQSPAQAVPEALAKLRPVTVYLEPEDEELLRALQEEVRLSRGEAVSLGEVVRMLLRPEPLRDGLATEGGEACKTGLAGPEADAERPPALAAVANRTIEVVLRVAELGCSWMTRFRGIVPKGIAGAFRSKDAVVLGDLYGDAIRAAARCRGKELPVPVRKFVALRARFHCEMPGCDSPMAEIHHLEPRSEGGSHHPDNCQAVCALHHGSQHGEAFVDGRTGSVASPGSEVRSRPADKAYQSARARATAAS